GATRSTAWPWPRRRGCGRGSTRPGPTGPGRGSTSSASPKGRPTRRALAEAIGADGDRLPGAVYAADAPGWLRAVPAAETLRRVRVQAYHGPDDPPRWRAATSRRATASSARRIRQRYRV